MDNEEKLINLIWSTGMLEMEDAQYVAEYLISNGVTVREPQKPLTEEELYKKQGEIVYLEYAYNKLEEHPVLLTYFGEFYAEFDKFGLNYGFDKPLGTYGFDWRCWAEKPTEEERKATGWDG